MEMPCWIFATRASWASVRHVRMLHNVCELRIRSTRLYRDAIFGESVGRVWGVRLSLGFEQICAGWYKCS